MDIFVTLLQLYEVSMLADRFPDTRKRKQNLHYYSCTWQFERTNPSGTIDSLKGQKMRGHIPVKEQKLAYLKFIKVSLLQFTVATIPWIQLYKCKYRQAGELRKYR
jgi:hypothetical protein